MDPVVICSLALLIALLAICSGCAREEDRDPVSAGRLVPEPVPTVPTVPEPRENPTLPSLPGGRLGSSPGFRNVQHFTPPEPVGER